MASVSLERLSKIYDQRVPALSELSLDIPDGAFTVLLGPSGCGKSTVLRLVAGLDLPDSGRIRLDLRDVTRLPPGERDVAMVFQHYALYPHLTVRENLEFPLRMRRVPPIQRRPRLLQVAELLQLGGLLDRLPSQLSGGQRQRVALGRALVREPRAFLLDEPLSNLDATLRAELRSELSRLHQRVGTTMLYVTHDQIEAMTMADRIAVLRAGWLEQEGTPAELYDAPATSFVAGFMGAPGMNLLPAQTWREGGVWGDLIPAAWRRDRADQAGVRPEALRLVPAGQGAAAEVTLVERFGADALVHLSAGGEQLVVRAAAGALPSRGQPIGVAAEWAALHWFGPDGRRLL